MKAKVLIIEDEAEINDLIALYLNKEGIETEQVETGEHGLGALKKRHFHLVILDINLPGIDGFEFLQMIRRDHDLPVIIVSARNTDEDMILGLGIGADDFVTKPFSPKVLVARVRSHLRRFFNSKSEKRKLIKFGEYTLDIEGNILEHEGERIPIPHKEFQILKLLISKVGTAMTTEQIYSSVWGQRYGDTTTVAIHVQRLRKKIEKDPTHPYFIETIKGFGYRFNPEALGER